MYTPPIVCFRACARQSNLSPHCREEVEVKIVLTERRREQDELHITALLFFWLKVSSMITTLTRWPRAPEFCSSLSSAAVCGYSVCRWKRNRLFSPASLPARKWRFVYRLLRVTTGDHRPPLLSVSFILRIS